MARPDVLAWARANAVRFGDCDQPLDDAEAAAIRRLVGSARVFAVGEPTHGAHEPLVQRNRLVRFAIEHLGVTAITLESGLAQGRRIDAFIKGGPGDVVAVARDYLSWSSGELSSNIILLDWLRAHNADPSHRAVGFYGADISGGDGRDTVGFAGLVVEDIVTYLERAAPARSAGIRARLGTFAGRFDSDAYRVYGPDERAELSSALDEAGRLLNADKAAMVSMTSRDEHDWAVRELMDARRLQSAFAVWPGPTEEPLPGLLRVSRVRDREMADVVVWALRREGPDGRVVTFAHNNHVAASSTLSRRLFPGMAIPKTMGMLLRSRLGPDYRVLLQASALNADGGADAEHTPGTVDEVFLATGPAPLFLDLRGSPAWWRSVQTTRMGFNRVHDFVPAEAADGYLYLRPLTCDPPARPREPERA